jgi:hypothetical protein
MPSFPYKVQVQIVVASIALHGYYRRKSQEDIAFREFDHHPDFVLDDFLTGVFPRSQTHGNHGPSRMDFVQDEIAASLMRQKKKMLYFVWLFVKFNVNEMQINAIEN